MIKLNEYVKANRKEGFSANVEYSWNGEMYSGTKALFYQVPSTQGMKKVFAFISYPKTEMPKNGYPAVLIIHGGNGSAFHEISDLWAQRGYVTIAPDFNGKYAKDLYARNHVNKDADITGYGSFKDMETPDPWAYFSVLSCMSAVDVLCADGCVDKANIFSCGLSWGGFIDLLFISQDKRVKASSVIYSSAFISDSEWAHSERACGEMPKEKWAIYDEYIDPKTYLKDITCPVFFTAGANDQAFTMENRRRTAEKINAKTFFGYRFSFRHGNFIGFEQKETDLFFKTVIKGKEPVTVDFELNGREITIKNADNNSEYFLVETKQSYTVADTLTWSETPFDGKITLKDGTVTFFIEKKTGEYLFSSDVINV